MYSSETRLLSQQYLNGWNSTSGNILKERFLRMTSSDIAQLKHSHCHSRMLELDEKLSLPDNEYEAQGLFLYS